MSWKNWPYWLRGGVILGFLDLIFLIWRIPVIFNDLDITAFGWTFTHLPLSWLFPGTTNIAIIFIVGIINWFMIGALTGWIIGKMKSK